VSLNERLAADYVDFTASVPSGQKFGRDTIHLFCSPIFVRAMEMLFDKNIKTISCGSGKERGILPGITCDYVGLSENNKAIAKSMLISPTEFRIGVAIDKNTTVAEFEKNILGIVNKFD